MKRFQNRHIAPLIIWIGLILIALFTFPNTSQIVREKGQISIPSSMQSSVADQIQKKANDGKNVRSIIAVFNNKNGEISSQQSSQIKNIAADLKNDQKVKVTKVTAPSDNSAAKKQLVSKDKTTQLLMIEVSAKNKVQHQAKVISQQIKINGLRTYVTGPDVLTDDFATQTQEGLKKTEIIAAIFIFFVLIAVFRSLLIPFISLATVGISYLLSLNIVMNLAKMYNFPISNFTQVFMVVVLFGIGTDYNILLYNRFKEEIQKNVEKREATKIARKDAGRTILYSGSSVLIGFTALALAKFNFYRSGFGVAVGVAVLLLVLLTLNPFFMSTLGGSLFWPSRNLAAHDTSKIWGFLSKNAMKHSIIMVAILILAALPLLFLGGQKLNFNDSVELPSSVPSKAGYNVIQEHFPAGMSGPTTIYIESNKPLDSQHSLSDIDDLTSYLKKEPGVKSVSSVTQPSGSKEKKLYLNYQLQQLTSGLNQSNQGIKKIQTGLASANQQLAASNSAQQVAQVQKLSAGAQQVSSGANQLQSGIARYTAGVSQLSGGASRLSAGTAGLSTNVSRLAAGSNQLTQGIRQLQTQTQRIPTLAQPVAGLAAGSTSLSSGLSQMGSQSYPLTSGISSLQSGASQLAANGSSLNSGAASLASGSSQVSSGVAQVQSQVVALQAQSKKLQAGLNSANKGMSKIYAGNGKVKNYLLQMQNSYLGNTFYIPQAVISSSTFQPAMNAYLSGDHKIASITVILKSDPSTTKAANQIRMISRDLQAKVKDTSLSNAKVAIGGQSSRISDLENLANGDFFRTVVIMLLGIGLALMVVTRSIIQALTIIGTLIVTYFGSLQITRLISTVLIGQHMLTWNTPFFSFIMLIALGVDYSIFLMMRYRNSVKEIPDQRRRIVDAATHIGTVVVSAAIILGGTFAALIPSDVLTLIQVATAVIVGLIILVFALPIVMPLMVKWTYPYVTDKMYQNSVSKNKE